MAQSLGRLVVADHALSGKVALVTGAASGIGQACAQVFAARGARVVIADLKPDAAEQARDGINAAGGTAAVHLGAYPGPRELDRAPWP